MAEVKGPISMIDPSQLLRPEPTFNDKPVDAFRDYSVDNEDPIKARVRRTYYTMHTNVTVDFVKEKREKWLKFNHFKSTIKDALIKLNELVDESDPDTDLPNIVHAFQTAERIRQDHPDDDWFHLTGLIHDLGKVMAFYGEPQWCVVGDTFPVGCKWADSIVYGPESFKDNPDTYNPKYNTKYGMYRPHCGLDQLLISWSHDEYMYQFLKHNNSKLPEKALYMIRYHSLYPWHAGGDYRHLTNEKDEQILQWVLEFNKYDLYTKSANVPDIDALWPYYEGLIDKYIPGVCECTKYGMYRPHCGLDQLLISWSHDEYMYQFLKHNNSKLPEKALYMIRYHSLYPWHAGGDYRHLTNEKDEQILQWVLEFNKYDLYTKSANVPDIDALWPYYEGLIDKYIPGVCEW